VVVSTADFIEGFRALSDRALSKPVTIMTEGGEQLVLVSAEEYARLKRRDRRAVAAEDLTDEEIDLIARAEVPAEFAHLDAELSE
jgi:PHD/YefM family antitoxin component YafN of YafNO toxin-antitoxin module